nr:MAG TPA: tail protein [Caudoviricetes sp.]
MLEIQLADHDPLHPLRLPPTGAELVLHLGYEGGLKKIGLFVADELELSGPPGVMTIRARAAPFDESKAGKSQLQTQKRRRWEAGKKLSDIVRTIAAEHQLQPVIAASMENITLPQTEQVDESDISFLVRVGKTYDAIIKPAAGRLILAKKGEAKTASGQKMPTVALRPGDVSSWRVSLAKREHVGTVIARWHVTKAAKLNEVKVGSGEPVLILKRYFPVEAMAMAAARSELDRRARRQATLSVTLPGRTDIVAEGQLVLSGFRDGVDGTWTVTRAEHALDGGGYVTSVEAEWPTEMVSAPY